jgi:hypothetical protein
MACKLSKNSYVQAFIVEGDYQPPAQPTSESIFKVDKLIKDVSTEKLEKNGMLYYGWNGINSTDAQVKVGDFSFVVWARRDKTFAPDYSIQKVSTINEEPKPSEGQQETPAPETTPTPAAEQPQTPEQTTPPPTPEASKCGTNYPTDIAGHWAEQTIKDAYDICLFKGFPDGTFRPDQPVTFIDALKSIMIAKGISPITGCYDPDCGSPFMDLTMEQGPWVRAAWNAKLIINRPDNKLDPFRLITRAEFAALVVKAFFEPHQGCYTPNCGAGYPDNMFIDIRDNWQGWYIRTLWDKRLVQGKAPYLFMPLDPITRAEMAKILLKAQQTK